MLDTGYGPVGTWFLCF